jgi:hypothetical protein
VRPSVLLIATCLAVAGCGGGDDDSASTPAPGSAPRPGVGAELDADGLDMVHDTLYECLRKAGGGVLARYINGQASVADSFKNPVYDDGLAAPKAERRLLDAGDAQFIGVRANRRDRAERGHADVDVLIFRSADRAEEALPALQQEAASAERDGIYIRVVKTPGKGAETLKRCSEEARPSG